MKKQETTLETQLYHLGWIVLLTVAALIAGKCIFFPDFSISGQMPPCVFHRLTGYFCPGCVGTTNIKALIAARLEV